MYKSENIFQIDYSRQKQIKTEQNTVISLEKYINLL